MRGRLRSWLCGLVRRLAGRDDPDRPFVPSPLDISVRKAHGGRSDELEREIARIHDEARALEERSRDE